jgi:alpha-L-arabinofuranosidase
VKLDGSGTVDAIATVDSKQNRIAVALVNFSPEAEQTLQLWSEAGQLPDSVEAWRITGPGLGALNIPGQKESVTTERIGKLRVADGIRLAPHSVTVLEIRTK